MCVTSAAISLCRNTHTVKHTYHVRIILRRRHGHFQLPNRDGAEGVAHPRAVDGDFGHSVRGRHLIVVDVGYVCMYVYINDQVGASKGKGP